VRKFLFIFFIGITANSFSQQLNTADEDFMVNNLVFNQEFIKQNKIKRIVAKNSTKSDGQPLKIGKEFYYWQFDTQGRTIGTGKTMENTLTKIADTIHHVMRYDKYQRLIYRTERVGKRLKSYHYKYNQDGQICQADIKEKQNYGNREGFILSKDSFAYHYPSDTAVVCQTFNENGSNYREEIYIYDNEKRVIEKTGRYLRGDIRTKEEYEYDKSGNLTDKIIYQDVQNNQYEQYHLVHDKIGNLHKIKTYRNDVNKRSLDIIYFEDTILLKAIIDQDVETHDLNIIKFEYEYFGLQLLEN